MNLLRTATLLALIASALMGVWSVSIQALRILLPENGALFHGSTLYVVWMGLTAFFCGSLVFFFVVMFIKQGPQRTHAAYRGYGTHE